MENGEIPPPASLAPIQRSCISRALPGQDQTQSQVLPLQKRLGHPKRCRLATLAASQQGRMQSCAEGPRVPGRRHRELSSGLCHAGTLQYHPLAGGNSQDLHLPGDFELWFCRVGQRWGWATQHCPGHPRARGTCSSDTSSGRHGNVLPEQQTLYFSPDPPPVNFLSLGSFQLGSPAPSTAQGCRMTRSNLFGMVASSGSPILEGAFS